MRVTSRPALATPCGRCKVRVPYNNGGVDASCSCCVGVVDRLTTESMFQSSKVIVSTFSLSLDVVVMIDKRVLLQDMEQS